jgi:hypothetical protein
MGGGVVTVTTEEVELLAQTHDLARSTLSMKAPEHDLTSAALRSLAAERDALQTNLDAIVIPTTYYMDPFDGGDVSSEGYIFANLCANVSRALYEAMVKKRWSEGYALKQAHGGNMRLSDIAKTLAELGAHMEMTVKFIDAPKTKGETQ